MRARRKRLASLSMDLDDLWSYRKTRGFDDWRDLPSFLLVVVPRLLELLDALGLRITVFVVGLDAAQERNLDLLRDIARRGHEIGNHSYRHEPWLHRYSREELREELDRAEAAIERATGERPVGFRGPGLSVTQELRAMLVERGYEYDASENPNVLSPLARMAYFRGVKLTAEQKEERRALNGTFRAAFGSNRAYLGTAGGRTLPVIPVSAMPFTRLPVHVSYLQALNARCPAAARAYAGIARRLFRLGGHMPSLLLHPTDLLGREDKAGMDFFPGMDVPRDRKLGLVREVLEQTSADYRVVTLREHAATVRSGISRPVGIDSQPPPVVTL